jgi:uncharacterized protein YecE (DUF72 family)
VQPGKIFVGPSGWSYRSWSQTVAKGVPLKQRLAFVSRLFNAVEINGSFYGQIARRTYAAWAAATPPAFRFALKGHRYVTHFKRLRDCGGPVRRLRRQAAGLGDKLAVVLWQIPSQLTLDLGRLDDFLEVLASDWPDARHALELRHRSWFIPEVARRLASANIAAVWSDAPDIPMWTAVTTNFVYVRLHGHTRKYASSYTTASLRVWANRVSHWAESGRAVHVYFDNDAEGAAIRNARAFAATLGLDAAADVSTGTSPSEDPDAGAPP